MILQYMWFFLTWMFTVISAILKDFSLTGSVIFEVFFSSAILKVVVTFSDFPSRACTFYLYDLRTVCTVSTSLLFFSHGLSAFFSSHELLRFLWVRVSAIWLFCYFCLLWLLTDISHGIYLISLCNFWILDLCHLPN